MNGDVNCNRKKLASNTYNWAIKRKKVVFFVVVPQDKKCKKRDYYELVLNQ